METETTPPPPEKDVINIPRQGLTLIVLLVALFGLGLGSGYMVWGYNWPTPEPTLQITIPEDLQRFDISEDGNPAIGPANAPITIVEFSDYQCPFCTKWHNEVFLRLLEEYPNEVRIVYRDFPLTSIHPAATAAAEAANCANEQGKYWDYHSALFSDKYALDRNGFIKIAQDLKLNVDNFSQCFDERRYAAEVQADYEYAAGLGIRSTPTFFLNGIPIVGAQPYDLFRQVIEKELAGEIP
jgi:protein-disulfide isomerase